MKIQICVRELLDRGLWEAWCELTGTNVWAVNEGLISNDEIILLDEKQAGALGLYQERESQWVIGPGVK